MRKERREAERAEQKEEARNDSPRDKGEESIGSAPASFFMFRCILQLTFSESGGSDSVPIKWKWRKTA